jgi:hypothetical protein
MLSYRQVIVNLHGQRTTATIRGAMLQLAERLAGWGNGIELVGPLQLRRQLAEIGSQLVEAYVAAY